MKKLIRLFGYSQLFIMSIFLCSNYAVAQRINPRTVKRTGRILKATYSILNKTGATGAAIEKGSEAVSNLIQSGQPYVVSWYVQMPDGNYYRVCQNAQNENYISNPYWCP